MRTHWPLLAVALLSACAYGPVDPFRSEAVTGTVDSQLQVRDVTSVNGIYDNCQLRSGSWSIHIAGDAPLQHAALSIMEGDDACKLWLTDLDGDENFVATPPLLLSETGATTRFIAPSGRALTISAVHVRTPEGLRIELVETSETSPSSSGGAIFAHVEAGSVSNATVQPSNYSFTFGLEEPLTVEVDAKQLVVRATGAATLVPGENPGEGYVVTDATLPEPAGQPVAHRAYEAEATAGRAYALHAGTNELPAFVFRLAGANLSSPVARTVIVRRSAASVPAYQIVRISFGQ